MTNLQGPACLTSTIPISSIRRKPKITYPSPTANGPASLRIEGPRPAFSRATSSKAASSSSSQKLTSMPPPTSTIRPLSVQSIVQFSRMNKKYTMASSLPLYHPLGQLALSLPELDASTIGLSTPIVVDDPSRRSSGRARRPAAKVRDADDTNEASNSTTMIPPVSEPKEKPSPKRRRNGGGGGNKRKRREADDGDATYPAKRTRNPRGAAVLASTTVRTPTEVSPPQSVVRASSVVEVAVEVVEEKKPERRTTRSRGALRRRDSSASEATVTSVSLSVVASLSAGRGKNNEESSTVIEKSGATIKGKVDSQGSGTSDKGKEDVEADAESTGRS